MPFSFVVPMASLGLGLIGTIILVLIVIVVLTRVL